MAVPSSTARRRPAGEPQQLGDVGGPGGGLQRPVVLRAARRAASRAPGTARPAAGRARVASSRRASWRGCIAARGYRPRHERPEHALDPRRRPARRAGRPAAARAGARRALPPARGQGRGALRLRPRRQPVLDAPRARARRARRRREHGVRLRHGGGHGGAVLRAEAPATCSSPAATATRGSAGSPREHLEPLGVEVAARADAGDRLGASTAPSLVWVETPSNPRLDLVDIAAAAEAAHAAGALLAVDNTVCTPLGQQPLAHGADFAMLSGTKALCGHSDVLLGAVSVRDPERARGAAPLAHALGRDRRRLRGLARPPLARHARPAARALLAPTRPPLAELLRGARRRRRGRAPGRHGDRGAPDGASRGRSSASRSRAPGAPRRSSTRARWSSRPRASAGSTRPPSAAPAGAPTTSPRASSASPRAARTPATCSPTSRAPSTRRARRRRRTSTAAGWGGGGAGRVPSTSLGRMPTGPT